MANFDASCPHCKGLLNVADEWVGMEIACPLCQKAFTLNRPATPDNSEETLLLLPKTPNIAQAPQAQQVQPVYPQAQMVPPPGYVQAPPAPPRKKSPSFFTSYKFFAILIAILVVAGGIAAINLSQDDIEIASDATIAAEKERGKKAREEQVGKHISAMVTQSHQVKTYDEAFAILDRVLKDFPGHSDIGKAKKRLEELENECAVIIFESPNNYNRSCLIFDYSPQLEKDFMRYKAGFYKIRNLNAKKRELLRSHTLDYVNNYEREVRREFSGICDELRSIIDKKMYRLIENYTAKRFTATGVKPGKYIWFVVSPKSLEFWWGNPEKIHRRKVAYTLD